MDKYVQPYNMFITGTTDRRAKIPNAIKKMTCLSRFGRAPLLITAAMWGVGVDESATSGRNPEGKDSISRSTAVIVVFGSSATNHVEMLNIHSRQGIYPQGSGGGGGSEEADAGGGDPGGLLP